MQLPGGDQVCTLCMIKQKGRPAPGAACCAVATAAAASAAGRRLAYLISVAHLSHHLYHLEPLPALGVSVRLFHVDCAVAGGYFSGGHALRRLNRKGRRRQHVAHGRLAACSIMQRACTSSYLRAAAFRGCSVCNKISIEIGGASWRWCEATRPARR